MTERETQNLLNHRAPETQRKPKAEKHFFTADFAEGADKTQDENDRIIAEQNHHLFFYHRGAENKGNTKLFLTTEAPETQRKPKAEKHFFTADFAEGTDDGKENTKLFLTAEARKPKAESRKLKC